MYGTLDGMRTRQWGYGRSSGVIIVTRKASVK